MTTTLSANGLLEIPEVFRKADALKPGQPCEIERVGHGEYHVRVNELVLPHEPKERLVDVLRSCPVKDWWLEPDRSERTSLEPPALFAE
jgi:hypothetical protein